MMYALRATNAHLREQPFETWVRLRVEATAEHADAPIGTFVDPMCGGPVSSRFVNNIWQWMHEARPCSFRKPSRRRKSAAPTS
jgi:hypothetical protein